MLIAVTVVPIKICDGLFAEQNARQTRQPYDVNPASAWGR